MPQSLEWRLSRASWATRGLLPFARQQVPYDVNNDGRASKRASALLFAHCQGAARDGQPIAVLELGAGAAMFARLLLDDFRHRCASAGTDYYARLTYYATDASPQTLRQWNDRGIFAPHAGHVVIALADALTPATLRDRSRKRIDLPPLSAVFANYLLDQLPADIVRRADATIERLCVRTRLTSDANLLQLWGHPTVDEVRALAESDHPNAQAELLRLLPLLEFDPAFHPAQTTLSYAEDALGLRGGSAPVVVSHAAVQCMLESSRLLGSGGFMLLRDMGTTTIPGAHAHFPTRFDDTLAIPVNFPLLMHRLSERGWETVESSDRDLPQIETWLLCRGEGAQATRRAFLKHFRRAHWEAADAALTDARAHKQAGRSQPALDAYRRALRLSPRDWRVLAEAGEFIALTAGDVPAALRLVERALDINPWTSPYLWTIKGDCLSRLQRWDEAHRAFTRAQQLDPSDLRAAIGLVNCGTQLGDDEAVLTQIAQALRADVTGSSRKALLAHQQRTLAVLGARHRAARDHLQKRNTAFAAALLRCPSTGP